MHKTLTKQEIIRYEWIEALRSGKYKQITHRLGNEREGFCAIGLLFHIMKQHNADISQIVDIVFLTDYQMAMSLNDCGSSFKEIADRLCQPEKERK